MSAHRHEDLINGTMLLDVSKNVGYWSPTFCSARRATETRSATTATSSSKARHFLSTRALGSHHLVFGYDCFNDKIWAKTHPERQRLPDSGDDTPSSRPDGCVFPQFLPNTATTTHRVHARSLQLSEGSNLRMHSLFVNDNWRLSKHSRFSLGLRLDRNQATDGGGANVGDEHESLQPAPGGRLGSEGRRPMGGNGQLRALRDADDQQRGRVDDRRGQRRDVTAGSTRARRSMPNPDGSARDDATLRFSRCSTGSTQRRGTVGRTVASLRAGRQHDDPEPLDVAVCRSNMRGASAARSEPRHRCASTACCASTESSTASAPTRPPAG